MTTLFILGESSFLASSLYLHLKRNTNFNIILLNYNNYNHISNATENDIIINFCGINRASNEEEYQIANHLFLKKLICKLTEKPFIIHTSSLMVYGFKHKNIEKLSNYQKWFILSKLDGEQYLENNYPNNKICIIRPSNIYGYNCKPYYNNLLSTLIYEKICSLNKINKLNKNSIRNMLSVEALCKQIQNIIEQRTFGKFNILSNNNVSLFTVARNIYNGTIPKTISIYDGDEDIMNLDNNIIHGINIILNEHFQEKIDELEVNMKYYIKLKNLISITNLKELSQPRGNMVEISDLHAKRLYKITFTPHSVRGNHYHFEQIEEFYTNRGKILYLLAHSECPHVVYMYKSNENDRIVINPLIIHTLSNDYIDNFPEIIIVSTQEFIKDTIPDTKYVNII